MGPDAPKYKGRCWVDKGENDMKNCTKYISNHGVQASSREEHPAWFADLSTNARTKEEFMNKNCQAGST